MFHRNARLPRPCAEPSVATERALVQTVREIVTHRLRLTDCYSLHFNDFYFYPS